MPAEPPGGQRDPGEQPVPAGVGQADLLLGGDPQPVVDGLGLLGGPRGDGVLQLRRVLPAAAEQPPVDPVDQRGGAAVPVAERRVQGADPAAGGGDLRIGRGRGAGHHGGQQGAQFTGAHPPQERGADHQHRRAGLGAPAAVRLLQPAVAVRRERDRGGRRDLQPVGELLDQAVQLRRVRPGQRHGGGDGRDGPAVRAGHQRGQQQRQRGDRADRPADAVPERGVR